MVGSSTIGADDFPVTAFSTTPGSNSLV